MESGTVVWLKSGSPAMTVVGLTNGSETAYDCQWFVGNVLEAEAFERDVLTKVDPNSSNDSSDFTRLHLG